MPRIIIRGAASVSRDDEYVTDPGVLRTLDGLEYDEERFTDHIGGTPAEDELARALEAGGIISFRYRVGDNLLSATTEYRSLRPLTDVELRLLVDYTMGQWPDGIGENWVCFSAEKCGYTIMCLTPAIGSVSITPQSRFLSSNPDAEPSEYRRNESGGSLKTGSSKSRRIHSGGLYG